MDHLDSEVLPCERAVPIGLDPSDDAISTVVMAIVSLDRCLHDLRAYRALILQYIGGKHQRVLIDLPFFFLNAEGVVGVWI
eukprot:CAMPEP_0170545690 /NCGR_PEP_ID=MMETSP0211-20121228/4050_1 /TAXON_ID=311385 /ORGANISM="Pseudokeronopsis sp., Strain OXSARD2" /LENGTH=80 /DNA_ID=CAMNT_0010849717 /DNA_START=59 /DNA_END=298 /DNA_ORIENTATION=-